MTVSVANKLVELRKKSGLSQEELAERLGISRQAVSKWERAEASPDTDNLITLARLYGVSLDELLLDAEPDPAPEPAPEPAPDPAPESTQRRGGDRVHITRDGIHVVDDEDEVHIDWSGIHVNEKGGDKVDIDKDGVFVNDVKQDDIKDDIRCNVKSGFPVSLVITVAYIAVGVIFDIWHPTWVAFLAIPVISSLITAIKRRNPHKFAYPVFAAIVFLLLGFLYGLWHPGWVVFLTVPVYYSVFKSSRRNWSDDDDDDE